MQTGRTLRQMFSTILLFCNPQHPEELWHDFWPHICDDLEHHLQIMGRSHPSTEDVHDYGLY
ncbi:hypothetical protein FB446DRAFT_612551, partial [Lentinula raphanica]